MLSSTLSTLAAADRWHGPGGWWPIFPLIWLLVVAAVVTTAALVLRRGHSGGRVGESRLAERFAAGEIGEQEYRQRLAVLKEHGR